MTLHNNEWENFETQKQIFGFIIALPFSCTCWKASFKHFYLQDSSVWELAEVFVLPILLWNLQLATHSNGEDGDDEGVAVAEDARQGGRQEGDVALHQARRPLRHARWLQGDPQDQWRWVDPDF